MSTNDGGPAFPIPGWKDDPDFNGMTLRDYFAAKAMQSMISSHRSGGWNLGVNGTDNETISYAAYAVADAMLAAREA